MINFSLNNSSSIFFLLLILFLPHSISLLRHGNETDRLTLLDFKTKIISDPLKIMDSWNQSLHFCNWYGVTCSPSNGRVIALKLSNENLVGTIAPSLGNLSFLSGLDLSNNSFHGEIPQEIGRLTRLKSLNLTTNKFGGKIPTNLTNCRGLKILNLGFNELVGEIPSGISSLSTKIQVMGLGRNNLTGRIPSWIGNFSSLVQISLALNNFHGGIPQELGKLPKLETLKLFGNKFIGMIPSSIYNISTIYYFSVTNNHLHGELPHDVGLKFPNLKVFAGGVNNFTGKIPSSLQNSSALQVLDFAENLITGTMPVGLGRLQNLYRLNFDDNNLGVGSNLEFLASLANCSSLEVLGLSGNMFGGSLPRSITNQSIKLKILTLGSNLLSGNLPDGIGNLVNLNLLGLEDNQFNGTIPYDFGKLQNLQGLTLNNNRFSMSIPLSLGNLTALTRLFMQENMLEGNIPLSLGNCTFLQVLNLSSNYLGGSIPKEIMGLSSFSISLSLADNFLTGSLPFEVGKLVNLKEINISGNEISGEIPSSLGSGCVSLERLLMSNNLFEGKIPQSFQKLRGLIKLDLSHNNLSGEIPLFLEGLPALENLDISDNDLNGEVPTRGLFVNASRISLAGNVNLCGGISSLLLPACPLKKGGNSSRNSFTRGKVVMVVIVVILFVAFSGIMFWILKRRTKKTPPLTSSYENVGISYKELLRSTNGFSTANLIGSGSFGSVYKGSLPRNGTDVAIKVINLQQKGATKTFIDECEALKSIRHRNLLKLLTVCSSVDNQGNDFKALVYEFMLNGNLDQWLHPTDHNKMLNMKQRLEISMDVAHALEYLHFHLETPIVHRDLKPSNVLLDRDMTAHVGDFGLASFVLEASNSQNVSEGLKGSIGYIAPECGLTVKVSTFEDVYSYGILLLEMFTGKRPTDDMFKDGLTIQSFVAMALPENVRNVVDSRLTSEVEEEEENTDRDNNSVMEEILIAVMKIGLSCSNSLPSRRMDMKIVTDKLRVICEMWKKS